MSLQCVCKRWCQSNDSIGAGWGRTEQAVTGDDLHLRRVTVVIIPVLKETCAEWQA